MDVSRLCWSPTAPRDPSPSVPFSYLHGLPRPSPTNGCGGWVHFWALGAGRWALISHLASSLGLVMLGMLVVLV